ncbi:MAG: murein L,D-transpeptidase catalytic domain family protein [Bdellovibrionaceae bacterium]|nr:murein L,D-transpeptidase catalytic domain family protein [Pseudobdellovibrionaceae bacterium]
MAFLKNFVFAVMIGLTFVACGKSQKVNLDTVMVPAGAPEEDLSVDTSTDTSTADDNRDPASIPPADTASGDQGSMVSLREAILNNSDVSAKAVDNAFNYFNNNQSKIKNKNYMVIFDIGQHSGKKRFYMINLKTGAVTTMHTAHGKNSDADNDGYASDFSNVSGSNKSSLGFMVTAETYIGKHGESLKLDGLESRNSNVRARAIVVHGASYVNPSLSKMGRSFGCPAVADANIKGVIANIKNGALFYIFNNKYD